MLNFLAELSPDLSNILLFFYCHYVYRIIQKNCNIMPDRQNIFSGFRGLTFPKYLRLYYDNSRLFLWLLLHFLARLKKNLHYHRLLQNHNNLYRDFLLRVFQQLIKLFRSNIPPFHRYSDI